LISLEGKRKVLGDKIKQWKAEQKRIHGADKVPMAKKSDPICKDFLQYQAITKEYNELKTEKKSKMEQLPKIVEQ